jgi:hypothetical protein
MAAAGKTFAAIAHNTLPLGSRPRRQYAMLAEETKQDGCPTAIALRVEMDAVYIAPGESRRTQDVRIRLAMDR